MKTPDLLTEIQLFLTRHCQRDKNLSRETILSYRDAIKLFILFHKEQLGIEPEKLGLDVLSYETITEFLTHLEKEREGSISTRNQRLSAIRALCKYVLIRHPEFSNTVSRCLAVPMKKRPKKTLDFLDSKEVLALLSVIDKTSWTGKRNRLMFDLCIRTGLRVSELTSLCSGSFHWGKAPYLTVHGKGRKERSVPLERAFARYVAAWIELELPSGNGYTFPTKQGKQISADAVQHSLRKYVKRAEKLAPTLRAKRVSPHTLRHTTAMHMLDRGVEIEVIALWLGHEQLETTQIYFSESLALKRKALRRTRFKTEWNRRSKTLPLSPVCRWPLPVSC
jgi:integrase/recombinase XerD